MSEGDGDGGRIGVGIAGLGRSGWGIHAHTLEPLSDRYRVVACMDGKEDRRRDAEGRLGCRTYDEFGKLLKDKDVELVVVAMPSHLHASCSIQAMKAGKHVVSEKPMASTLADADEMIVTSKRTGRVLAIFQNQRYALDFQKVREVIESGKLGRIVQISMASHGFSRRWDWQTLQKYGGGSLNNTGPHLLDQAVQLLHEKQPEVWCQLECALTLGDADDHAKVVLRAPGEPVIDIEITSACAYPREKWLVMGTRGTLAGGGGELRWKYIDEAKQERRVLDEVPTPNRSYNRDDLVWEPEERWSAKDHKAPGMAGFYGDLYKAIRSGAPLVVTPESVRVQMYIIERCHEQCPLDVGH